jgi:DNA primase small subunit
MTPREYYRSYYPYESLVAFLTCNGVYSLADCEFALEGKSASGGKIYKRYVSVRTAAELRERVSTFTGISAFHFGAIYSDGPTNRATGSVPMCRVLSFDIDLTDKEFLSLSCPNGDVSPELCDAAYFVSAMSAYILRLVLQEAFGYSKILIVYSGRRGVHVHVCDEGAMRLDNEARSAIVSYINGSMDDNGLHATSTVRLVMEMHNLRREVYRSFEKYLVKRMGILDNYSARVDFVNRLNLSKHEAHGVIAPVLATLAEDVMDEETGAGAWAHIERKVRCIDIEWVSARLDCVVLAYVWPRLDENVTRAMGHLIKVPFSCHAASGRVAVAMATEREAIYRFKPARDAPSLECWDQGVMDAAVARFSAEPPPPAPCAQMDVEDHAMVVSAREPGANKRKLPRRSDVRRKPSPLVPASTRPSWATRGDTPTATATRAPTQAQTVKETVAEAVSRLVLKQVSAADATRRDKTWVGMPLDAAS